MELTMEKGRVGYGKQVILTDVDLSLEPGTCIGLIGPNGAGKSTLLRTLAGVQPCLGGKLLLDGQPIEALPRSAVSRKVAYLPQDRELPFGYTAGEVVLMGRYPHLTWYQQENRQERELAQACLTVLGMEKEAERPVTALSGGQRQRVLLARILIQQ
uniref:ABC transporter ATP-binding protein n=1 Tax=Acidaminococcus fermentans TaxID=905 RepID=UPI00242FD942